MTTRSRGALRGAIGGVGLGVCLGAAAMYLFDADSGRRRRALARDRAVRVLHHGSRSVKSTARGLAHRARGAAAASRWRPWRRAEEVPDEVVQQRVRATLGHFAGHPALIDVRTEAGAVTLSGPVPEREAKRLLRKVRKVPGVKAVNNRLERVNAAAGRDGGSAGAGVPAGDPA
ncbi:MAG TPA: BON domain-containing protein [Thermoanaerobaculia bacterium]|nr:BON domain-containing protein [Thermoanaerobaculia bacterium]